MEIECLDSTLDFHSDLLMRVKVKRSLFNSEWVNIKVLNLCTSSCLIKTDEDFETNDIISLSLKFSCHPSPVVIDSLYAQVISKTKECSCYLYHLNLEHSGIKRNIDITFMRLRQVELMIFKKKALEDKRKIISNLYA
jgi:hypothetical protein